MTELKPGWQRVKFGELAECINDRVDDPASAGVDRYVGLEHLDPDSLMIRRWGSPADVESTKLRFKPGDIIFGKRRAYQRKLAVADSEGICSAHAMVLRAKTEFALPEFLPYFMQSDLFMKRAIEISVGSLSPTINWKTLATQEFAIPPLQRQRHITKAMNSLSTLKLLYDAALRSSETAFQATVNHALQSYALIYPVKALSEGCLRITDGTHQPPPFTEAGIPFFLVKTISSGSIDWSQTKFVSHETYSDLTRRLKPGRGDVLYTAVGATYGVAKFVDFDSPFTFQRHIAHIIPSSDKLLGEYIELFLNSLPGKRLSDKHAKGSAQPTVTLRSLSSFHLPFPPIEVQSALIAQANAIRLAKYQLSRQLKKLEQIKSAISRGWCV